MYEYIRCTSGNPGPPLNGFVRHCVQELQLGDQKPQRREEILRIYPKLVFISDLSLVNAVNAFTECV